MRGAVDALDPLSCYLLFSLRNSPFLTFFLIPKAPNWPISLSVSVMSAPCHSLFTSKIKYLELLTFSPVELSEARPMAAGQPWGAAEGRWQEVGHQWTVAGLCASPDQNKTVRNSTVICRISKLFACERCSFVTKTRPCWNYNNYLIAEWQLVILW